MLRLAFALCLTPFAAAAQAVDCVNQPTQRDMTLCAYQDWQAADARLNDVYARAVATVQAWDSDYAAEGDSEETRLRRAQRAWISYRDANCDAAGYQMRGGSAEPMLVNSCLQQMTDQRIAELERLASGG